VVGAVVELPDVADGVELPQAAATTATLAVRTRAAIRVPRMSRCPFLMVTTSSW
jgi:hypothetical protein